ncbi:MAG: hypothetical protein HY363_05850 [Candidatus Aenigmarchaeota archaeon]|nr:hypothetical protein [Candidatus Aenigmarchaeota archaeon]
MDKQKLHLDCIGKDYWSFHHACDQQLHFSLAHSIGDEADDTGAYSEVYQVISRPVDFKSLVLDVLTYLKKQEVLTLSTCYLVLTKKALAQIGNDGKQVLEEIIALHNDFVSPKRTNIVCSQTVRVV